MDKVGKTDKAVENRKLKRTTEEEERLPELYAKGELRCYFCDRIIDESHDDHSTEYGIFSACGDCYHRYGNPDQPRLELFNPGFPHCRTQVGLAGRHAACILCRELASLIVGIEPATLLLS